MRVRQHHSSSLHKQAGGDSVAHSVPRVAKAVHMSSATPSLSRCCTPARSEQHSGGFLLRNRPTLTSGHWQSRCAIVCLHGSVATERSVCFTSNHKLPLWCSRTPCPAAIAADALCQSWQGWYVYAFPPIKLIARVRIQILGNQVREALVVVSWWPGSFGFRSPRQWRRWSHTGSIHAGISCRRYFSVRV